MRKQEIFSRPILNKDDPEMPFYRLIYNKKGLCLRVPVSEEAACYDMEMIAKFLAWKRKKTGD